VSLEDLFTRDLWASVADGLRGDAKRWWADHQDDLVELSEAEVKQMLAALQDGDTVEAKQKIALHWARHDREAWEAYRDGTTKELRGIAARRARIMEALEDLSERAARTLGRIARGALGI
jgi:hypothetical protein